MSTSTRNFTITSTLNLVTEECCSCGVTFAMPAELQKQLVDNPGRKFYCPSGHQQWYVGKSDTEKLREAKRQLEAARAQTRSTRDQLEASERSNRAYRGVITRTKRRIAAGVCPCCRRHFRDLADHMAGQHPEYVDEGE